MRFFVVYRRENDRKYFICGVRVSRYFLDSKDFQMGATKHRSHISFIKFRPAVRAGPHAGRAARITREAFFVFSTQYFPAARPTRLATQAIKPRAFPYRAHARNYYFIPAHFLRGRRATRRHRPFARFSRYQAFQSCRRLGNLTNEDRPRN